MGRVGGSTQDLAVRAGESAQDLGRQSWGVYRNLTDRVGSMQRIWVDRVGGSVENLMGRARRSVEVWQAEHGGYWVLAFTVCTFILGVTCSSPGPNAEVAPENDELQPAPLTPPGIPPPPPLLPPPPPPESGCYHQESSPVCSSLEGDGSVEVIASDDGQKRIVVFYPVITNSNVGFLEDPGMSYRPKYMCCKQSQIFNLLYKAILTKNTTDVRSLTKEYLMETSKSPLDGRKKYRLEFLIDVRRLMQKERVEMMRHRISWESRLMGTPHEGLSPLPFFAVDLLSLLFLRGDPKFADAFFRETAEGVKEVVPLIKHKKYMRQKFTVETAVRGSNEKPMKLEKYEADFEDDDRDPLGLPKHFSEILPLILSMIGCKNGFFAQEGFQDPLFPSGHCDPFEDLRTVSREDMVGLIDVMKKWIDLKWPSAISWQWLGNTPQNLLPANWNFKMGDVPSMAIAFQSPFAGLLIDQMRELKPLLRKGSAAEAIPEAGDLDPVLLAAKFGPVTVLRKLIEEKGYLQTTGNGEQNWKFVVEENESWGWRERKEGDRFGDEKFAVFQHALCHTPRRFISQWSLLTRKRVGKTYEKDGGGMLYFPRGNPTTGKSALREYKERLEYLFKELPFYSSIDPNWPLSWPTFDTLRLASDPSVPGPSLLDCAVELQRMPHFSKHPDIAVLAISLLIEGLKEGRQIDRQTDRQTGKTGEECGNESEPGLFWPVLCLEKCSAAIQAADRLAAHRYLRISRGPLFPFKYNMGEFFWQGKGQDCGGCWFSSPLQLAVRLSQGRHSGHYLQEQLMRSAHVRAMSQSDSASEGGQGKDNKPWEEKRKELEQGMDRYGFPPVFYVLLETRLVTVTHKRIDTRLPRFGGYEQPYLFEGVYALGALSDDAVIRKKDARKSQIAQKMSSALWVLGKLVAGSTVFHLLAVASRFETYTNRVKMYEELTGEGGLRPTVYERNAAGMTALQLASVFRRSFPLFTRMLLVTPAVAQYDYDEEGKKETQPVLSPLPRETVAALYASLIRDAALCEAHVFDISRAPAHQRRSKLITALYGVSGVFEDSLVSDALTGGRCLSSSPSSLSASAPSSPFSRAPGLGSGDSSEAYRRKLQEFFYRIDLKKSMAASLPVVSVSDRLHFPDFLKFRVKVQQMNDNTKTNMMDLRQEGREGRNPSTFGWSQSSGWTPPPSSASSEANQINPNQEKETMSSFFQGGKESGALPRGRGGPGGGGDEAVEAEWVVFEVLSDQERDQMRTPCFQAEFKMKKRDITKAGNRAANVKVVCDLWSAMVACEERAQLWKSARQVMNAMPCVFLLRHVHIRPLALKSDAASLYMTRMYGQGITVRSSLGGVTVPRAHNSLVEASVLERRLPSMSILFFLNSIVVIEGVEIRGTPSFALMLFDCQLVLENVVFRDNGQWASELPRYPYLEDVTGKRHLFGWFTRTLGPYTPYDRRFENNRSAAMGGALSLQLLPHSKMMSGASFTFEDSEFVENTAMMGGGAVEVSALSFGLVKFDVLFKNCHFSRNAVLFGEQVLARERASVKNPSDFRVFGSLLAAAGKRSGRTLSHGGAIAIDAWTYTKVLVTHNVEQMMLGVPQIDIMNSSFIAGGVSSFQASLRISGCVFSGNAVTNEKLLTVNHGGALAVFQEGAEEWGMELALEDSTFFRNSVPSASLVSRHIFVIRTAKGAEKTEQFQAKFNTGWSSTEPAGAERAHKWRSMQQRKSNRAERALRGGTDSSLVAIRDLSFVDLRPSETTVKSDEESGETKKKEGEGTTFDREDMDVVSETAADTASSSAAAEIERSTQRAQFRFLVSKEIAQSHKGLKITCGPGEVASLSFSDSRKSWESWCVECASPSFKVDRGLLTLPAGHIGQSGGTSVFALEGYQCVHRGDDDDNADTVDEGTEDSEAQDAEGSAPKDEKAENGQEEEEVGDGDEDEEEEAGEVSDGSQLDHGEENEDDLERERHFAGFVCNECPPGHCLLSTRESCSKELEAAGLDPAKAARAGKVTDAAPSCALTVREGKRTECPGQSFFL
uniref:Uncharacterized protein n=1 Tax=Chromera velia CCMP2878 TaxID=1169474 RepID=A0A0G4FXF6_9ALVE|eukprot:Cvel_19154.t1-p1 / transcript=Cvel_19154.t1 / gene=Cvel_19154 / organism=Chromera_velia_CCMP2878 / gene_product=hypothetical protein / transcript_product=hypothetical protein / location=Cvel_scaffold1630:16262-41992(-) / protein_length=2025 / sequence_SO=supercontig / SO=protein_coding / is_pseudo=false